MTNTTERDSLHSSLGEAERYAKELEGKLAETNGILSTIAIKAGAGLCQFTGEGKHAFLQDISRICEQAGFDVIGQSLPPPPPST